jgi:hypothetical protein
MSTSSLGKKRSLTGMELSLQIKCLPEGNLSISKTLLPSMLHIKKTQAPELQILW